MEKVAAITTTDDSIKPYIKRWLQQSKNWKGISMITAIKRTEWDIKDHRELELFHSLKLRNFKGQ